MPEETNIDFAIIIHETSHHYIRAIVDKHSLEYQSQITGAKWPSCPIDIDSQWFIHIGDVRCLAYK